MLHVKCNDHLHVLAHFHFKIANKFERETLNKSHQWSFSQIPDQQTVWDTSELAPSEGPSSVTSEEPSPITTTEEARIPDPASDDVMRILMIGNSFSYYYVEELYGMAKAAGIKMQVCNLYLSRWHHF